MQKALQSPPRAGACRSDPADSGPTRHGKAAEAAIEVDRRGALRVSCLRDLEVFEQIQRRIEENRQRMENQYARKRALRKGAALLTGLVRCGHCGHAMDNERIERVSYRHRALRLSTAQRYTFRPAFTLGVLRWFILQLGHVQLLRFRQTGSTTGLARTSGPHCPTRTGTLSCVRPSTYITAGDRIRTDDVQLGKLAFYH